MCREFLKEVLLGETCQEAGKQDREGEDAKEKRDPRRDPLRGLA